MKFGRIAVAAAEGVILAHSVRTPGFELRKGARLTDAQIEGLERHGIRTVIGAQLEDSDVEENEAALLLARHIAGPCLRMDAAFTGRCNLFAEAAGLVRIDQPAINKLNAIDEAITVATLPPFREVEVGAMVATVKIIPFAVPEQLMQQCLRGSTEAIGVAPYNPLSVCVISTILPSLKLSTVTKTVRVLRDRLAPAEAAVLRELTVAHDPQQLADSIRGLPACDLVVIFGASAITDRRDVVPVAIELAGGTVDHLGMPVDPGNLLLLGRLPNNSGVPVIGAPGCARSPKENGFDFVLRRLLAGLVVTGAELRAMGVGGLLSEITTRPQLRNPSG